MPIGTQLESQFPDDWDVARRNAELTEKHLRPPMPNARVYNDANLAITNNTLTALTFNSERWDTGGLHSTSANTSRLTAVITGLHLVGASVNFASNATGYRQVGLLLNGATFIALDGRAPANGQDTTVVLETEYRLARGDYVEVWVRQTSGGNLNVTASGNFSPEFWMQRVGGYTHEGVA